MLELILNIAYTTALTTFGIVISKPVPPTELHAVAQFEGKPITSFWSDERHCRFHGVVVPFERDWEIVSENTLTKTKTVLPPEPGKIHSYGIIINKKTCPGKEAEHMLLTGSADTAIWKNIGLLEGRKVMFTSVGKNHEDQPKWLPQVMKVIEVAEAKQSFVKDFLDYSRGGAPAAKPTPVSEVSAKAEITVAEPAEANSAQ